MQHFRRRWNAIRISDQLLAEVKKKAAESGRTIATVIEDALRESFLRQKQRPKTPAFPVYRPKRPGLQPGVDLDDTAGLLELMDSVDSRRR